MQVVKLLMSFALRTHAVQNRSMAHELFSFGTNMTFHPVIKSFQRIFNTNVL